MVDPLGKYLYANILNDSYERVGRIYMANKGKALSGLERVEWNVDAKHIDPEFKVRLMEYIENLGKPSIIELLIEDVYFSAYIERVFFDLGTPYFRNEAIKVAVDSIYHDINNLDLKSFGIEFHLVLLEK